MGGGYCRLQMPLRQALAIRGAVAGHKAGRPGGGGGVPPLLPMHPPPPEVGARSTLRAPAPGTPPQPPGPRGDRPRSAPCAAPRDRCGTTGTRPRWRRSDGQRGGHTRHGQGMRRAPLPTWRVGVRQEGVGWGGVGWGLGGAARMCLRGRGGEPSHTGVYFDVHPWHYSNTMLRMCLRGGGCLKATAKAVTGGWKSGRGASAGGSAPVGRQYAAAKSSWNSTGAHPERPASPRGTGGGSACTTPGVPCHVSCVTLCCMGILGVGRDGGEVLVGVEC